MTLSRREFVQTAAAMGASLAWGGPARASRTQMARDARPLSRRRRVGRSRSEQRDPVDPAAVRRRRAAPAHRRSRRGRGLPPRRRAGAGAGVGGIRLDHAACWSAASSPRASIGIASPTPRGTAAASAAPSPRRAPNDPRPVNFAFVSCQDVNEGKLNAYRRMIFEDERARAGGPARFRPPPRRLHLRGRRISRGSEDALRPHDLRGRAHSGRRQGRQFPFPADARRLSRRLQGLSRRSRPAGRARALAVRRHVGQSRILLAGLAEHPAGRRQVAAGPEHQGRRQPGLVGISAVALQEGRAEHRWEQFEAPAVDECRDREVGRERPWRRAEQPRPRSTA